MTTTTTTMTRDEIRTKRQEDRGVRLSRREQRLQDEAALPKDPAERIAVALEALLDALPKGTRDGTVEAPRELLYALDERLRVVEGELREATKTPGKKFVTAEEVEEMIAASKKKH